MLRTLFISTLLITCWGCKDNSDPVNHFPKVYNLTAVEFVSQGGVFKSGQDTYVFTNDLSAEKMMYNDLLIESLSQSEKFIENDNIAPNSISLINSFQSSFKSMDMNQVFHDMVDYEIVDSVFYLVSDIGEKMAYMTQQKDGFTLSGILFVDIYKMNTSKNYLTPFADAQEYAFAMYGEDFNVNIGDTLPYVRFNYILKD